MHIRVVQKHDSVRFQHHPALVSLVLRQDERVMQRIMSFFLSCLHFELGVRQLLLQLKVVNLKRLVFAIGFALLKLDLLDEKTLRFKLFLSFTHLIRHELDLLTHSLTTDFLGLGKSFRQRTDMRSFIRHLICLLTIFGLFVGVSGSFPHWHGWGHDHLTLDQFQTIA